MPAHNFTDPTHNFLKRSLSNFEKRTLMNRSGRALVLPGEPGRGVSEVDELVTHGFDEDKIVLVERDPDVASAIYAEHFDRTGGIHQMDIHEFLRLAGKTYSYIHLDYCGHITRRDYVGMQEWIGKLEPIARVRITTMINRKVEDTLTYEHMLHQEVIQQLCDVAADHAAADDYRWLHFREDFKSTSYDTSQLLVIVMMFNFMFGLRAFDWTDRCTEDPYLPPLAGTHRLTNIQRFVYADEPRAQMQTVWADLVPLSAPRMEQLRSTETVLHEMALVFDAINHPSSPFRPDLLED